LENSPDNTGNHWITIVITIATLIITLVQPFMQVLFSMWLKKRQRRRSAANPDINQLNGWIKRILIRLNRIPPTVPPLIGIALAIVGLIFFIRPQWIATQMTSLFISVYVGIIIWNIAIYYLNRATKNIDSRIDAIVDILKAMVRFSSKGSENQNNEDSKNLSELQLEAFKEFHAWLKDLETRLQDIESLQEKEKQKRSRKKPTPLD
jgi:hypothetical protein